MTDAIAWLTAELTVEFTEEFRKNDVMSGCIVGVRLKHVVSENFLKLFGVVSCIAWREHILFKVLPEEPLLVLLTAWYPLLIDWATAE